VQQVRRRRRTVMDGGIPPIIKENFPRQKKLWDYGIPGFWEVSFLELGLSSV